MKRPILLISALVLVVALIWFLRTKAERDLAASPASAETSAGVAGKSASSKSATGAKVAPPLEISDLARDLNSPSTDIRADLKLLGVVIDTYRSNARSNPVGTNAEITAVLAGKNPFRLALIPPTHSAINPQGELCDRWGRPFFFHQISGTQMEIRSSGPDQKMWTEDDSVAGP